MRRYKTPEQLKAWRKHQSEMMAKWNAKMEAHEREMQQYADEHAIKGDNIICPDGVVRRPSRMARVLSGRITPVYDYWVAKSNRELE